MMTLLDSIVPPPTPEKVVFPMSDLGLLGDTLLRTHIKSTELILAELRTEGFSLAKAFDYFLVEAFLPDAKVDARCCVCTSSLYDSSMVWILIRSRP